MPARVRISCIALIVSSSILRPSSETVQYLAMYYIKKCTYMFDVVISKIYFPENEDDIYAIQFNYRHYTALKIHKRRRFNTILK
jgi:hypothetical protein